MAWSSAQQTAVAVAPKISSILSLLGSSWILIEVLWGNIDVSRGSQRNSSSPRSLQDSHLKRHHPYHRLLLAMSTYDIMESVWNFASTWPLPADESNSAGKFLQPIGNKQTCTAQGFFLMLSVAVPIYNAFLSLYYLLVIKYRYTDDYIKKWIEPCMHFVAFLWAIGTSLTASAMGLMNNANLWCWIAPPPDCSDEDSAECTTKTKQVFLLRWVFYFGPLWICILASTVFTLMVFRYVRKVDRKSLQYRSYSETSWYFSSQASGNIDASGQVTQPPVRASSSRTVASTNSQPPSLPTESHHRRAVTSSTSTPPTSILVESSDRRRRFSSRRVSFLGVNMRSFSGSSTMRSQSLEQGNSNEIGQQERQVRPFSGSSDQHGRAYVRSPSDPAMASTMKEAAQQRRRMRNDQARANRRTKEVFHQALYYLGTFYLTHVWSTTNRILQYVNGGRTIYGLILIHSFFDPCQGFFNYFVYQRPRYLRIRKAFPEAGRSAALKEILRFSFLPQSEMLRPSRSSSAPSSRPPAPSIDNGDLDTHSPSILPKISAELDLPMPASENEHSSLEPGDASPTNEPTLSIHSHARTNAGQDDTGRNQPEYSLLSPHSDTQSETGSMPTVIFSMDFHEINSDPNLSRECDTV